MSSYYGVVFPEFWTGLTGRQLRTAGKDAQILGLYLATNRHTNMIGLYRLLVDDVRHETGLGLKAIERGFTATANTNYALYDAGSAYVWVKTMARIRLGLKPGEALDPEDKKVVGVSRLYHAIDPNPFLGEFFDANHRILRIKKRRDGVGLVVDLSGHHYMSGLPSPLEAPCKPVTESGIRDQVQDQEKARRLSPSPATGKPDENRKVIQAIVRDLVNRQQPGVGFADLKDLAKERCAALRVTYDADAVGSALEQAIARRARAS